MRVGVAHAACCISPGSPACSSPCRSCGSRAWAAALQTGLLVLPFAVASLSTASNSYKFSARFGR